MTSAHSKCVSYQSIIEPRDEKTCLCHMRTTKTQISVFVVRSLDSMIHLLAKSKIPCSWAGWFEYNLVEISRRQIFRDVAHIKYNNLTCEAERTIWQWAYWWDLSARSLEGFHQIHIQNAKTVAYPVGQHLGDERSGHHHQTPAPILTRAFHLAAQASIFATKPFECQRNVDYFSSDIK